MNSKVSASLRDRVLTLARDRMLLRGQPQLSLRQIASELGVTPMAIYRHFAHNEDLQLSLLDAGFREFGTYLARSRTDASPLQRLELLAEGFIDFAIDRPGYFELMFLSSQIPAGLRNREVVIAASLPTFAVLVEATQRCILAGDLPAADPEVTARDLLAFCIGQAALFISGIMNWSVNDARAHGRSAFGRHILQLLGQQPCPRCP